MSVTESSSFAIAARRAFGLLQIVVSLVAGVVIFTASGQSSRTFWAVLSLAAVMAFGMVVWPENIGQRHSFGVRLAGIFMLVALAFLLIFSQFNP